MGTNKIRVIIAEDNPDNRNYLRKILDEQPDIEILGEVDDGSALVSLANSLHPQVIFVDIEMSGMDGMTAVKTLLEKHEDMFVVFVTGHIDFAIDAFEISSFDYILKPYTAERIQKCLEKIRSKIDAREFDFQRLARLIKSTEKLYIKCGHELHFIDTASIYYIEKEKKKTVINTVGNKYETNESINDLEQKLDASIFFRSHKSYLINLKMVEKVIPWGSESYLVKFLNYNGDALMSRAKVKLLHDLLE